MIHEKQSEKKKINFILSVLVAWSVLLVFASKEISDDNLIYAIGEINAYDNSVFGSNVYMGNEVISPRFIVDSIFSVFMHINGGNWASIAFGMIHLGIVIMAVAIANIVYQVCKRNHIIYTLVLAGLIAVNGNNLAGFSLRALGSVSITASFALAVLAISFVCGNRRDFNLAWIFLAIAALFHIHEGIYGFVIVFVFFLSDIFCKKEISIRRNWGLILYVVSVLCVVMPSMITDFLPISNEEFVNIYSFFRHPHHLVPSSWGLLSIIRSFAINLSLIAFRLEYLFFYGKEKIRQFLFEAGMLIAAWVVAVGMVYVFTEMVPNAWVVTLFLPKFFKYVVLVSLVWCVQTVESLLHRGEYLIGYVVLYYVFMTQNFRTLQMIIYFFIVAVVFYYEHRITRLNNKELSYKVQPIVAGGLFMGLVFLDNFIEVAKSFKMVIVLAFLIELLFVLINRYHKFIYRIGMFFLIIALLTVSTYGHFYYIKDGRLLRKTGDDYLLMATGNGLYELAKNFNSITEKEDVFLADPDDTIGAGWFQVISERNCYAVFKVVPSCKCTVREWYDRCLAATDIFLKDTVEIADIMQEADIQYLLVKSDYYEKMDASEFFSAIATCETDDYRVYQLAD